MSGTAKASASTAVPQNTAQDDPAATSAMPSSTPSRSRGSRGRWGVLGAAGRHRRRRLAQYIDGGVTYVQGEWLRSHGHPYDSELVRDRRQPLPWTENEVHIGQERLPEHMAKEYYSVPQRYVLGIDGSDTAAMALLDVETGQVSFADTDVLGDTRWDLTDKGERAIYCLEGELI